MLRYGLCDLPISELHMFLSLHFSRRSWTKTLTHRFWLVKSMAQTTHRLQLFWGDVKQSLQNVCPHSTVTGPLRTFLHMGQLKSRVLWSMAWKNALSNCLNLRLGCLLNRLILLILSVSLRNILPSHLNLELE